jgi:predicted RNase H-like HicB family nuclease
MIGASKFPMIVEWSDEDGAFVGRCPGVIGPCCHGADERKVYRELGEIVEERFEIAELDDVPPPIN